MNACKMVLSLGCNNFIVLSELSCVVVVVRICNGDVLDACVRVNGRRDVLTVKKSNGRLVKVKLHHLHVRHEQ